MNPIEKITVLQPHTEISNPHIWTDRLSVLSIRQALFEPLVRVGENHNCQPGLAASWQVAPDARTWTFHLREGVRFHDGSSLRADDVIDSLAHASSSAMPGSYGTDALLFTYLGGAHFEKVGAHTVRIVTPEPMADLLDLLAHVMILPSRVLSEDSVTAFTGSGPMRLEEAEADRVVTSRFEHYWGHAKPVNRVEWATEPDDERRVAAFLEQKADIVTYLTPVVRERINQSGVGRFTEMKIPLCVIIIMNLKSPKCQDVRVRQALNYAADVEDIIARAAHGYAAPLNGPLSQQHTGCNPDVSPYPHNPDRARLLLSEAGYPDGIELEFEVPTISPDESLSIAGCIEEHFLQAGIRLKKTIHHDRLAYALMVKEKRFNDLCIFDSSPASTYRVLREKLHGGLAGPWWAGYSNPQVDNLMEKAWATTNGDARVEIYRRITAIVREDAPWIFLYNPLAGAAFHNRLQGWSPAPDNTVSFQ